MFGNKLYLMAQLRCRSMSMLLQSKAYIDGSWTNAASGRMFDVVNPANGAIVGQVPNMDVPDVKEAINAAYRTFKSESWFTLTGKQRSSILKNWFRLIESNTNELAELMTSESGKPINESRGEVLYGNSFIEWFAEEARRIYGEIVPAPVPNRELFIIKQPLGVAALITPWNFPLAMVTRKVGAALAAGCTTVIKPSEDTPLTALALAKLAEEAGIPRGVINVVTSDKQTAPAIGKLFCTDPLVRGISFTGSTEVGKLLYRNSADGVKRISLELGGNAPFIVFDSANLEKAVEAAIVSKFRNCGQTCVAANRFFVQAGIYDSFIELLQRRVESLKVGDGSCGDVQIGPLINRMQFEKVSTFVEDARKKGAYVLTGGKALPDIGELFYAPTIVTNTAPHSLLYTDEVFGPVVTIIRFTDETDAIERANQTQRGLAGYFFTENIQQVFRVARRLEVGMIGINEGLISAAEAPFGGVKESGIGREGCHHGIDEYVDVKYICLGNLMHH